MSAKLENLEGWYTLHDFRMMDWSSWLLLKDQERTRIQEELASVLNQFNQVNTDKTGSFGVFSIAGSKANFMLMQLHPTLEDITAVQRVFDKTRFAQFTKPVYSYVSMVELSNYVVARDQDPMQNEMVRARLFPAMPAKKNVCFYPMNKRRDPGANWYMESHEERRRMMHDHGMIGRSYAGKIVQMIGGSTGLDDWEWGVTLFADDPVHFKKIVTEMRFDEVSARFGEFGPFYVGTRLTADEFVGQLS